ncbi:Metallo-dependent phosphatase [Martensiomyces pterosporus]|nr:Metallo-dependent phosphatase [Martensiomyces pterosporus]
MRYYHSRWFVLLAVQLAGILTLVLMLRDSRIQTLRSTAFDWLNERNMYPCAFRKLPMVYEHGDSHYYVVWETTCPSGNPLLEWWTDSSSRAGLPSLYVEPWYKKIDGNHHRYTAIFGPVHNSTNVHYQINNYKFSTKSYTIARPERSALNRVLVIADNQNGPTVFRRVLSKIRGYYGTGNRPDTILHVGDSVQIVEKLADWHNQLFSPMEDGGGLHHSSPIIFVPGNHDHDKSRKPDNANVYTDMYHGILDTDGLGKKAATDGTYHQFHHSVTVGSARIIVLDAECHSPEQSEFLKRELQSPEFANAVFRIVAVHIPPYIEYWDPTAWNKGGEKHWGEHIRLEYDPLFREYGVDLVISGHQHNYQRATVRRGGTPTDSGSITYAIVGGAGGGLDLERVEDWKMYNVTYLNHHFVSLDIENRSLRWTAHSLEGGIIDQFSIMR